VAAPPLYNNFDQIPVVAHGPHELGDPRVRERLGRDWLAQSDAADVLATSTDAEGAA